MKQPHILLLVADDLGWSNVGFHRSGDRSGEVSTPNIDKHAGDGVRLERMYAYSFCAPSRASLLSGRLPYHVSLQNIRGTQYDPAHPEVGGGGVPRNMTTLPQRLRAPSLRAPMTPPLVCASCAPHGARPAG